MPANLTCNTFLPPSDAGRRRAAVIMRELLGTEQVWELTGDSRKPAAEVACLRIAWQEGGRVYVVDHPDMDFNLDELEAPPPIPQGQLATPWQSTYLQAPDPPPQDAYIKSLSPLTYRFDYPEALSEELRHEIEAYTLLSAHPHPNICPFYGSVRDGPCATGIVLKRMHRPLESWKEHEPYLTRLSILRGVKRGIDHLHGLGLVHNDLNPNNIMLDDTSRPVIIDYGACRREGASRDKHAGTPGWFRQSDRSTRENDYYSLGLIGKWLDGWECDPMADYMLQHHAPWTDRYLEPKLLVVSSSSRLFSQALSRMLESGGSAVILHHRLGSDGPTLTVRDVHQVRVISGSPVDDANLRHAWSVAGEGDRFGEVDVVLFPISSHDLEEQVRRLRTIVRAIPHDLRPALRQPCLGLFLEGNVWGTQCVSSLEHSLQQLSEEAWVQEAKPEPKGVERAARTRTIADPDVTFKNYALIRSADDSQSDEFRVRFWRRSHTIGGSFSRMECVVRTEDLAAVLLETPQNAQNEEESWAARLLSMSITNLLWMTVLYIAFTLYLVHSFAR